MNTNLEQHCSEEGLELYAMGQLDEFAVESLEEHILLCEECRVRLDEADRYVHAMARAAQTLREESLQAAAVREQPVVSSWKRWFVMPAPAWSAAAVAVFAIVFVTTSQLRQPQADGSVVFESLVAERGNAVILPAHRLLDLKLDARGLALGQQVQVGLVNEGGKTLEQYTAKPAGDIVEVRSAHALNAGTYLLRLYAPGSRETLREFALNVK